MSDSPDPNLAPLSERLQFVEIEGPNGRFSVAMAGEKPELQNGTKYKDDRHKCYFYYHLIWNADRSYDVRVDLISRDPFGLQMRSEGNEDRRLIAENIEYFLRLRSWSWPFGPEDKSDLRNVLYFGGITP